MAAPWLAETPPGLELQFELERQRHAWRQYHAVMVHFALTWNAWLLRLCQCLAADGRQTLGLSHPAPTDDRQGANREDADSIGGPDIERVLAGIEVEHGIKPSPGG